MNISKDQILQFLREQGHHDQADQADKELPGEVDTDNDGGLLQKFGVDPSALLGKLGGLGKLFG